MKLIQKHQFTTLMVMVMFWVGWSRPNRVLEPIDVVADVGDLEAPSAPCELDSHDMEELAETRASGAKRCDPARRVSGDKQYPDRGIDASLDARGNQSYWGDWSSWSQTASRWGENLRSFKDKAVDVFRKAETWREARFEDVKTTAGRHINEFTEKARKVIIRGTGVDGEIEVLKAQLDEAQCKNSDAKQQLDQQGLVNDHFYEDHVLLQDIRTENRRLKDDHEREVTKLKEINERLEVELENSELKVNKLVDIMKSELYQDVVSSHKILETITTKVKAVTTKVNRELTDFLATWKASTYAKETSTSLFFGNVFSSLVSNTNKDPSVHLQNFAVSGGLKAIQDLPKNLENLEDKIDRIEKLTKGTTLQKFKAALEDLQKSQTERETSGG